VSPLIDQKGRGAACLVWGCHLALWQLQSLEEKQVARAASPLLATQEATQPRYIAAFLFASRMPCSFPMQSKKQTQKKHKSKAKRSPVFTFKAKREANI
jgi:hypothetical protein